MEAENKPIFFAGFCCGTPPYLCANPGRPSVVGDSARMDRPQRCLIWVGAQMPPGGSGSVQPGRDLLAVFNYYVAIHGAAFYGNLASSFSAELYLEYMRRGKPAGFLNWARARVCCSAEPISHGTREALEEPNTHSHNSNINTIPCAHVHTQIGVKARLHAIAKQTQVKRDVHQNNLYVQIVCIHPHMQMHIVNFPLLFICLSIYFSLCSRLGSKCCREASSQPPKAVGRAEGVQPAAISS